jgi:acyl-CoA synthetase (AMP-forming)/AMP-acid ligase II
MTSLVSTHLTANKFESISQPQMQFTNLIELLEYRALSQPDRKAYSFLENGEIERKILTYSQVDREAKAIAARLQQIGQVGDRALLVYPSGIEFITAFLGCLYAGIIAVPVYPPRRNSSRGRLESIVEDSGAAIALTTRDLLSSIHERIESYPELSRMVWLDTDHTDESGASAWRAPNIDGNSLAFLQYTSGSTGTAKGVRVTHRNLLHNESLMKAAWENTERSFFVGWLPLFHDMGLIGVVLQSLYVGTPCTLLSPVDFLQKPSRWLQALSDYQAVITGSPNFAYDLCVRKVTPEQMKTIDLSRLELAFNGAEPIRIDTLNAFAEKFAPCGFRKEAFYPCYGMAEATLFISGGRKNRGIPFEIIDEEVMEVAHLAVLANNQTKRTKTIIGCGHAWGNETIVIVNPETRNVCSPRQVGEVWVSGTSVTDGYWQQPEKTAETFHAYINDTGERPFLRTGDLGFLREDGELFITGRLKDVIIIRGRNHYPQDIERTVEQSHHALIPDRCAAFSLVIDGEEKLIIAVEVERRYRDRRQGKENAQAEERRKFQRRTEPADPGFEVTLERPLVYEEIISNIRQAVVANHGLQVHNILLLRIGTIPKTSSGKIQRYACRKGFIEKTLTLIYNDPRSL